MYILINIYIYIYILVYYTHIRVYISIYIYIATAAAQLYIYIHTYIHIYIDIYAPSYSGCVQVGRGIACLIFSGLFPQKNPIIIGSLAERDLHVRASNASSPPCNRQRVMSRMNESCPLWMSHVTCE